MNPCPPRHVVIVLSGTARFAQTQRCSVAQALQDSLSAARGLIATARAQGVAYLTFFGLLGTPCLVTRQRQRLVAREAALLSATLRQQATALRRRGICVRALGERSAVPDELRDELRAATGSASLTPDLVVQIAWSYSAKRDISAAVRTLAQQVKFQTLRPEQLSEELLQATLQTQPAPDPDLILYTGGLSHLSDAFLFESAYAELFFTPVLFPALLPVDFEHALQDYSHRQRRFGKTAEQSQSPTTNSRLPV